jgi:hypothetical protein
MTQSNTEARNHCYHGKTKCNTYSVCVFVALVMQHAMRMRCFILSSVVCLAVPYFSTLSHKQYDFRRKIIQRKMRVLIFSTNFLLNISHSKKNSARHYHKCTHVFG